MKLVKLISCAFMLSGLIGASAQTCSGGSCTAASCNTSDVQKCINSTSEAGTCTIPPGSCTWTSGVTISGKGMNLAGSGSGRIIATSTTKLASIGAGTQTWTLTSARVDGTFPLGPNAGQTLTVYETGTSGNYMTGTVSSFNSSTGSLVMNITSSAGTCADNSLSNCSRWLITTQPSTTIINNTAGGEGSGGAIVLTEDTSFNSSISGIQFGNSTNSGTGDYIEIEYNSSGVPVLIHDNWFRLGSGSGSGIFSGAIRGVVWNNSFDASPYAGAEEAVQQSSTSVNTWTTPSFWGASDATGTHALYVETNDFHALQNTFDNDNNGRLVFRYNIMDNASATTHGADSSSFGERYFEYYNNINSWFDDGTGATFDLGHGWILVRGGTFVAFNNTFTPISGYYNGPFLDLTVQNLNRNSGPDPCWGAGQATPAGQNYHAPRQVGFGYVTGLGTASYTAVSPNPTLSVNGANDSITYVGDSEPAYAWNNTPAATVSVSDYSPTACSGGDSSVNYIESGRDYFANTAKPGYTPYTYPHPLTGITSSAPSPPVNVTATPNQPTQ